MRIAAVGVSAVAAVLAAAAAAAVVVAVVVVVVVGPAESAGLEAAAGVWLEDMRERSLLQI